MPKLTFHQLLNTDGRRVKTDAAYRDVAGLTDPSTTLHLRPTTTATTLLTCCRHDKYMRQCLNGDGRCSEETRNSNKFKDYWNTSATSMNSAYVWWSSASHFREKKILCSAVPSPLPHCGQTGDVTQPMKVWQKATNVSRFNLSSGCIQNTESGFLWISRTFSCVFPGLSRIIYVHLPCLSRTA